MEQVHGPYPHPVFGNCLEVGLTPDKTCSFDCIYCNRGKTIAKTIQRKEWFPLEPFLEELARFLAARPDMVLLSGNGEPTLNARIGELIEAIHAAALPVAVSTNGSLLSSEAVRRDLNRADVVLLSLSAAEESMFEAICRPHRGIRFEQFLEGIKRFQSGFPGRFWVEPFFLAGHTALLWEAKKIAALVNELGAERIIVNTATQPPLEEYAVRTSTSRLKSLATLFSPKGEVSTELSYAAVA
ncbi:MAG: radical SAM protein [Desulfovibrionales bacterium]